MADDLICQPFERTDGVYTLQDAVCLTQAQWDVITPEELAAIHQQRWDNWYAAINAPAPPEPPVDPPVDPVVDLLPPEG